MQPPTPPASNTWCGNLHQAQQVAAQGVQWLFGCLPCVKGHHRIHPTSFEPSDALFITIEAKKKLRLLHLVPDASDPSLSLKKNQFDQVDADYCSLDSSGEDYWFMRWNRPIRPNFQKNSCNCSFRRSQLKFMQASKDSKSISLREEISAPLSLPEVNNATHPGLLPKVNSVNCLAEKISQTIMTEAVQKSSEICMNLKDSSSLPSFCPESFENCEPSNCDNVGIEDVKLTVRPSETEFGGYVNPVFIASNDALDRIPTSEPQQNSCDNHSAAKDDDLTNVTAKEGSFIESLRDHNANNHSLQDTMQTHIKNEKKGSHQENVKHRKSCLMGSKGYLKKPLLLLIHGAGSNCEIWRSLMNRLVQGGYECVAPDLLGHGLSSAPDVASLYTFHSYLQDLLFIFDKFVTEGRSAVVLGHGYGCSIAAAIARYRPEQVVQLILISGGGPTPLAPRTPPSVSPCLRACLEPLLMCGFKRDVVYSVCGKQMEPCTSELSAVPRHIVEHIAQGHIWVEGDAAFHRRIVAPTLLVHGMKDEHITLVQECEMERTIPRSFLEVIPDAGHWAMLDTPVQLSHMILCFIDWWAPPNRTQ